MKTKRHLFPWERSGPASPVLTARINSLIADASRFGPSVENAAADLLLPANSANPKTISPQHHATASAMAVARFDVAPASQGARAVTQPFQRALLPFVGAALQEFYTEFARNRVTLSAVGREELTREIHEELLATAGLTLFTQLIGDEGPRRRSVYETLEANAGASFWRGLFDEYPVLDRMLGIRLTQLREVAAELAERLAEDSWKLRELGILGCPSGSELVVDGLALSASDRHLDGRRVIRLIVDGRRIFYKPRSVAGEVLALCGLRALNEGGARFKIYRLLDRGEYGWAEDALPVGTGKWNSQNGRPSPPDDGALVDLANGNPASPVAALIDASAIALALGLSDLHGENLVFTPEGLCLLDAETLLNPVSSALPARADVGFTAIDSLVFGADLLARLSPDGDRDAWNSLQGGGLRWRLECCDSAGVELRKEPHGRGPRPAVQEEDCILNFDSAASRFETSFRRSVPVARDILEQATSTLTIRALSRNTRDYAKICDRLYHPSLMRDGAEFALELANLFRCGDKNSGEPLVRSGEIVASEVRQLARGDIPYFWTKFDSVDLFDDTGIVARQHFRASGRDSAHARLEDDAEEPGWVRAQANLAASSLACAGLLRDERPRTEDRTCCSPAPVNPVDWSGAVGAEIMEGGLTLRGSSQKTWASGTLNENLERFELSLGDPSLFGGSLGVIIGLRALASPAGDKATEPRRDETQRVVDFIASQARGELALLRSTPFSHLPIGWQGLGGILRALDLLARPTSAFEPGPQTHEPFDIDAASALATSIAASAARRPVTDANHNLPADLDFIVGFPGLLAAIALERRGPLFGHAVTCPDFWTRVAAFPAAVMASLERDNTFDWANPRTLGFAHGLDGVVFALATAAANPRFAALHSELNSAIGAVLERQSEQVAKAGDTRFANAAWCNGAAGYAYAKLSLLVLSEFASEARSDLEKAAHFLATTTSEQKHDHLCCGMAARLDALVALRDAGFVGNVAVESVAADLLARIRERGGQLSVPAGRFPPAAYPGLYDGASGIVFAIRRSAGPCAGLLDPDDTGSACVRQNRTENVERALA